MRGKEGEREGGTGRGERGRERRKGKPRSLLSSNSLFPPLAFISRFLLLLLPLFLTSFEFLLPPSKKTANSWTPYFSLQPPPPPGAYQPDGNIWPFQALRLPWAGTWGTDRYSLIQLGVNGLGAQSAQQGAETVFVGLEAEVAAAEGRGTLGGGGCLRERERGKERERWRGRRNEFKTSSPFHLALSVNYNDNKQPSPTTACSSTAT